jgi:hypothetical protein
MDRKKETKGFDWYQQSQRGAGMHTSVGTDWAL